MTYLDDFQFARRVLTSLAILLSILTVILSWVVAKSLPNYLFSTGVFIGLVTAFILSGVVLRSLPEYFPFDPKRRFAVGAVWGTIFGIGIGTILSLGGGIEDMGVGQTILFTVVTFAPGIGLVTILMPPWTRTARVLEEAETVAGRAPFNENVAPESSSEAHDMAGRKIRAGTRIMPAASLSRTIQLGALAGLCPAAGYLMLILLYAISSRAGYIAHAGGTATIISGVPIVQPPPFTTILFAVGTLPWGIIMSRVGSRGIRWWQGAVVLPASFLLAYLLLLPVQKLASGVSLPNAAVFLTPAIAGAAIGMLTVGVRSAAILFVASPLIWLLALITDGLLRGETMMLLITGLQPYTVPYLIADSAAQQVVTLILHGIGVALVLRATKAPVSAQR